MSQFGKNAIGMPTPASVSRDVYLPRRQKYYASPVDWRDEILYFLLVDRFSNESLKRPILDRSNLRAARPQMPNGNDWRWDYWSESGSSRWQGGTIKGIIKRLDYLEKLGITTLWLSPVFKQRSHLDTYHGYGIQDFLEVDPHFGNRADLVKLVDKAHKRGIRIILDVIFNHSGDNWLYAADAPGGPESPAYTTGRYRFGAWRDSNGNPTASVNSRQDGVWPVELYDPEYYTRAGTGNLGAGDIADPNAEHKRTDFCTLRDFQLGAPGVLTNLALCYKYWIALTDCDGFRIDTLKHVTMEEARNFCGTIKEFAANLGKANFFLVGEVAGGDYNEDRYLDVLDRNLNAALDIGEMRLMLNNVAKGIVSYSAYFDMFKPGNTIMGSHRSLGERHVSILDDHDHVFGEKIRFSSEASSNNQVVAGVAMQLFSLGIPCIYYGTEQAFAGPESAERKWLPEWKRSDRYLREAMFGPDHPKKPGAEGLQTSSQGLDQDLPGFGPFGTAGHHCFDENHPAYVRISALTKLRSQYPSLQKGRQYHRPISFLGSPFAFYGPGEIVAWSRILDDEEALCVLNSHGADSRGADVVVDALLNPVENSMTVVLNTAQAADLNYSGSHPIGSAVLVKRAADGTAYVEIRDIKPSEVVVLANHPQANEGMIVP